MFGTSGARRPLKLSFILIKNNFRCLAEAAKCVRSGGSRFTKSFNCWIAVRCACNYCECDVSVSASAYDDHFAHVTRFTRLPLHAVGSPFVLKDNSGSIFERGKCG